MKATNFFTKIITYFNPTIVLIVLLVNAVFFMLNVGILIAKDTAHHLPIDWTYYFINEGSGAVVGIALLPLLFYLFKRFPISTAQVIKGIGLYLLFSVFYSLLFTSLMYGLRFLLYSLKNITIGDNFDRLPYRYLMEYFKQLGFFWLTYLGYRYYTEDKKRKLEALKTMELQQLLTQTELHALRMRLNPHFFFNTLNTISSLIYDQPVKADQLIVDLSRFLRKALTLEGSMFHTIKEEITLTQQYIAIMQRRFEEQLTVDFSIPTVLETQMIPVLLLQPLVENAIQYTMKTQANCHIRIAIEQQDDYIKCSIEDNGPGMQAERLGHGKGMGLNIVMKRLERLYDNHHQFSLQNKASGGLRVDIKFPIAAAFHVSRTSNHL